MRSRRSHGVSLPANLDEEQERLASDTVGPLDRHGWASNRTMTAIESRQAARGRIRSIDPLCDLREVIHLIDEAFSGELNPMAQRTLRDLRSLGRLAWLLGPFLWVTPYSDLFSGLVWVEDQRVVGNLTLTRSRGGGPGCWVISNVVVAPAFRGLGIGRTLIGEALRQIRSEGGRRALLQVRADNPVAIHLYHDFGFTAVDTVLEMFFSEPWPDHGPTARFPAGLPLQQRGHGDGLGEYSLAREAIPGPAQQMHPLHPRSFRVGWSERILRSARNLLGSVREYRMGIVKDDVLCATLNVWASRRLPYHRLQIMVHPDHRGVWEEGMVNYGLVLLQRHSFRPVYAEAHVVDTTTVDALLQRGFIIHRELVQMSLDIGRNPR